MLKAEGEMEQRKAAERSVMRFVAGVGLVFNPFLVLQVHRDHLLQETLQQARRVLWSIVAVPFVSSGL